MSQGSESGEKLAASLPFGPICYKTGENLLISLPVFVRSEASSLIAAQHYQAITATTLVLPDSSGYQRYERRWL